MLSMKNILRTLYRAEGTIGSDQESLLDVAGDLGGPVSFPVGPGSEVPESS